MMARITVVATEHPVPLPSGQRVQTLANDPDGSDVELDMFIQRRLDAGELREMTGAELAAAERRATAAAKAAAAPKAAAAAKEG
jgi:hypothetical protein